VITSRHFGGKPTPTVNKNCEDLRILAPGARLFAYRVFRLAYNSKHTIVYMSLRRYNGNILYPNMAAFPVVIIMTQLSLHMFIVCSFVRRSEQKLSRPTNGCKSANAKSRRARFSTEAYSFSQNI